MNDRLIFAGIVIFVILCLSFGIYGIARHKVVYRNVTIEVNNTVYKNVDCNNTVDPIVLYNCTPCVECETTLKSNCDDSLSAYKSTEAFKRSHIKNEASRIRLIQNKYDDGYGANCSAESTMLSDDVLSTLGFLQQCIDYGDSDSRLYETCSYGITAYNALNEYLLIYNDACLNTRHPQKYIPDESNRPLAKYDKYKAMMDTSASFIEV